MYIAIHECATGGGEFRIFLCHQLKLEPLNSSCLVAELCLTLSDLLDWGPPGSSVHGISKARI